MTDRELLELAAKAAAMKDVWWDESGYGYPDPSNHWNPLTDDGDALRLAVKLGIHLTNSNTYAWASQYWVDATESLGDDPYAATRRAIVRAAAEIGRALAAQEGDK